jgi:hypothetical protein
MDIDVNELELILLPGKCPPMQYRVHYEKTYACWREVWEDHRKELGKDLYSDEFTRQDEVLALFHKGECTALTFFKWVDFNETPVKDDSYFEIWPEMALHKLCKKGKRVIVCSQFTVHFNYRKSSLDVSWKDLLMGLLVERFRHSDADAMTGTMRLSKNMGATTYKTGAVPIIQGLVYKGEETVDLVGFYQDSVKDSVVPGIAELIKLIFPKTIALVNPIIKTSTKEVKRAA